MAINAYVGLMGHGKTFQAVKVLAEAYKNGRSIITNIEGINEEEIRKYILKHNKDFDPQNFGTIKIIKDDVIKDPNFFPIEDHDDEGNIVKVKDSTCKAGDLVVIDEAWRYWNKTEKLHKEHEIFFRKMRHYTNEKGHTSDLILITQDHTALNTTLKNLIEFLFLTKKLKALGNVGENKYTLSSYEGNRPTKSAQLSHTIHTYDKEIFPLYQSYANKNAKEQRIDDRTSYFSGAYFKYSMIISLILFIVGPIVLYNYFSKKTAKTEQNNEAQVVQNSPQTSSKPPGANGQPTPPTTLEQKPISSKQIVGALISSNRFLVFVKDENGHTRPVNNPKCVGQGSFLTCEIDNELLTYYK